MEEKKINIYGIYLDCLDRKGLPEKISGLLNDGKQHQITTPNPEFLLNAHKDEEYFYILNKADLSVPDGIGLKFAAWAMGKNLNRFAGADLIYDICAVAEKENKSVYLLGGGEKAAQKAEMNLKNKFSGLRVAGAAEGLRTGEWKIESGRWLKGGEENAKLLEAIRSAKPDILFVAFGGGTKQEKWIYHNLKLLPSVKMAVGVGGTFDFISGNIKRAPKLMRLIGLEWLWRLMKEPARIKRITNAVVVFPCEFIKWRFVYPLFYRPNVACMLYRKEGDKYKILILERSGEKNHWQLPQGGTDGQKASVAGKRELREELGTEKFKLIKTFKNVHRYIFAKNDISKFGAPARYIEGYKGQKQSLVIAEFEGEDAEIKTNFWEYKNWKWVDAEKLVGEVHPYRQAGAKNFIEKFNGLFAK